MVRTGLRLPASPELERYLVQHQPLSSLLTTLAEYEAPEDIVTMIRTESMKKDDEMEQRRSS